MPWIPAAISAGSAILGAIESSKASGQESDAEDDAAAERMRQFQQAMQFLSPFQQAGVSAIPGLESMSQEDPTQVINKILGQFQQSPAQKFAQQQSTQGVQSQAERLGLLNSGAERGALAKTISGLASQNQQQFLQNVLGQRQNKMQMLENLFGTGAQSAQSLASGAIGTGAGVAGDIGLGGAAQGAGSLGIGNMFGSLSGLFGSMVGSGSGGSGGGSSDWLNPDSGQFVPIGN